MMNSSTENTKVRVRSSAQDLDLMLGDLSALLKEEKEPKLVTTEPILEENEFEGTHRPGRITFFKKSLKLDLGSMFTFRDSTTTENEDNSEDQTQNKIFGFIASEKKHDFPGLHYISGTFWELFKKKKRLGEGTSGIVRRCVRRSDD